MGNVGPFELIIILVLALIVFGPKRLPEIGRSVGRGLKEFRRASNDLRDEFERATDLNAPAEPAVRTTPAPAAEETPAAEAEPAPKPADEPPGPA
jgi:sec-independent protein translocase protein TatA